MAGRPQRRARLAAAGLPVPHGNGVRPPFEHGNQAASKHYGYSLLGIGQRGSEIADQIRPTLPAYAPADEPSLLLLATALARIERANAAIEIVDATSTSPLSEYLAGDEPTLAPNLSALRNDLRAWINTARRLANDLGLTPTSRAKLGLDIAATQRTLSVIDYYEAREAAGLPLFEDADGDPARPGRARNISDREVGVVEKENNHALLRTQGRESCERGVRVCVPVGIGLSSIGQRTPLVAQPPCRLPDRDPVEPGQWGSNPLRAFERPGKRLGDSVIGDVPSTTGERVDAAPQLCPVVAVGTLDLFLRRWNSHQHL